MSSNSLTEYVDLVYSLPIELQTPIIAFSLQLICWENKLWLKFIDMFIFVVPHPAMGILLLKNKLKVSIQLPFKVCLSFESEVPKRDEMPSAIMDFNVVSIRYTHLSILSRFWNSKTIAKFFICLDTSVADFTLTIFFLNTNNISLDQIIGNHKYLFGRDITSLEVSNSLLGNIFPLRKLLRLPLKYIEVRLGFYDEIDANVLKLLLNLTNLIKFNISDFLKNKEWKSLISFCESNSDNVEIKRDLVLTLDDDSMKNLELFKKRSLVVSLSSPLYDFMIEDTTKSQKYLCQMKSIKKMVLQYKEFEDSILPKLSLRHLEINSNKMYNSNLHNLNITFLEIRYSVLNTENDYHIDKQTIESIPSNLTSLNLNMKVQPKAEPLILLPKFLQDFTCRLESVQFFNLKNCFHLSHLKLVGLYLFEDNHIWETIPCGIEKLTIDGTRELDYSVSGKMFGVNFDLPNFRNTKIELIPDKKNRYICINKNLPFTLSIEGWHWARINLPKSGVAEITFDHDFFPQVLVSGESNNWLNMIDLDGKLILPSSVLQVPNLFAFNKKRLTSSAHQVLHIMIT